MGGDIEKIVLKKDGLRAGAIRLCQPVDFKKMKRLVKHIESVGQALGHTGKVDRIEVHFPCKIFEHWDILKRSRRDDEGEGVPVPEHSDAELGIFDV